MSLAAEERLEAIISRGELGGAFFFHGDATRLRDDAARRLTEAALDASTRDFNLDVFRGGDAAPDALAAALAMPPVMAPRRVVVLYEAERLTPSGCDVVEGVLDALPPDLTFIVTASIPRGSRKKIFRSLKDKASSLEWASPRDAEIPGWLIERARRRYGAELVVPVAEALAAAVGPDLSLLDAELEKLCSTEDGQLTVERVEELVPNIREVNRWAWLDLVADREYREARRQLPALLASPDASAVGLLAAMVDHHLYLGIALEGGARAIDRALVEVRKPYLKFKTRSFVRQAGRWTPEGVDRALGFMQRADAWLKRSGSGRDQDVLEDLLLALEHSGGGGNA